MAEAQRATADAAAALGASASRMADRAAGEFSRVPQAAAQAATQAAAAIGGAFDAASQAIGRAALDVASDGVRAYAGYEKSLAQITGLAGESRAQVSAWSKELLALGPALGKGPQELAEALYFVSSAGFHGAEGMKVLEAAAKLSAAGMGQTKTIADALTSALNAYAGESLSAARAADIMTAGVRYGKLEADALTRVLGMVLPAASAAGVSFEDVTASLAAMSSVGMSASQASTSLQGFLSGLAKPSEAGAAALASVGLSYTRLRNMVREDGGTIKAMRLLQETLGDSDEAMAAVVPNARAFRGEMALLRQNAAQVDEVFRGVTNSVGDHNKAFANASETLSFAFDQAKASVQAAAISVGEMLAPTVKDVVKIAGEVLRGFQGWPEPLRQVVVIGGLVAAGVMAIALAWGAVGIAVALAAAAITVATGGLNLVAAGVLTLALGAYTAIAGTIAAAAGLAAGLGYVSGAFTRIRDEAVALWEYMLPVRRALSSLFRTLYVEGVAGLERLKDAALDAWQRISGGAAVDWAKVREYALNAVIAVEYGIVEFSKTWELVSAGSRYAVELVKGHWDYLAGTVIPAALRWAEDAIGKYLTRGWLTAQAAGQAVLNELFAWVEGGFTRLGVNIGRIFAAIDWRAAWAWMVDSAKQALVAVGGALGAAFARLPDLVAGKINERQMQRVWERALPEAKAVEQEVRLLPPQAVDARKAVEAANKAVEDVKNAVPRDLNVAPFRVPIRVEGEREKELREDFERLGREAGIGYAAFREMRLKQFADMDRIEKAAEEARRRNPPRVEEERDLKKHRQEAEKWQAAIADSAEALSRIQTYRDKLSGAYTDQREIDAAREARLAADRQAALERELDLTRQIADTRRAMIRREEELGVRPERGFTPAPVPQAVEEAVRNANGVLGGIHSFRDLSGDAPRPVSEDTLQRIRDVNDQAERRRRPEADEGERRRRPDLGGEEPRPVSRGPRREADGREPEPLRQLPEVVTARADQADVERQNRMIALLTELVNLERSAQRKPALVIAETDAEQG